MSPIKRGMINTGNFGTKTKVEQYKSTRNVTGGTSSSRDAKIWNDYKGVCEGGTPSEGVSNGSVGS